MAEKPLCAILILEDEMISAESLRLDLEDHGYRVSGVARNRSEALACARLETPALALVDIRLANGDNGLDVADELRRGYGIPSIFVSASGDEDVRARANAVGGLGFVHKPYLVAPLIETIRTALGQMAK